LTPTWLVVAAAAAKKRRRGLDAAGVEVIEIEDGGNSKLDVRAALAALAGRGITRLLIEGGPRLATACLRAGVVDRVAWFTAPTILGGDALPAVADLAVDRLDDRFDLRPLDTMKAGPDMLQVFEVVASGEAQN
jgi:diaminohydroxyphosphoribosylaminopyrimidine deaminase/5-amino-6-(5-phosphoribosylamino)uracil reductase